MWAVTVQREEKHGSAPRKPVNVPSVPTFPVPTFPSRLSPHLSQEPRPHISIMVTNQRTGDSYTCLSTNNTSNGRLASRLP